MNDELSTIIPQSTPIALVEAESIPLAREWAWDFDNYRFAKNEQGQMYQVTGDEAIKVWLWKLFKTRRWYEIIHTDDYGTDIWSLLGRGFSAGLIESEAIRIVTEAIEINLSRYIKRIGNISVTQRRGKLQITIPLTTIYSTNEEVFSFES